VWKGREGGRGEFWLLVFPSSIAPSKSTWRFVSGRQGGEEGGREGGAYQAQDIFSVNSLVLLLHHPLGNSGQFVFAGEEAPVHEFLD